MAAGQDRAGIHTLSCTLEDKEHGYLSGQLLLGPSSILHLSPHLLLQGADPCRPPTHADHTNPSLGPPASMHVCMLGHFSRVWLFATSRPIALQALLSMEFSRLLCPWYSPGFSVHGILQARILKWVAVPSSRGSSRPSDWTQVSFISCVAGRLFACWTSREAPGYHGDWPVGSPGGRLGEGGSMPPPWRAGWKGCQALLGLPSSF